MAADARETARGWRDVRPTAVVSHAKTSITPRAVHWAMPERGHPRSVGVGLASQLRRETWPGDDWRRSARPEGAAVRAVTCHPAWPGPQKGGPPFA
jgi:hypothetical protein